MGARRLVATTSSMSLWNGKREEDKERARVSGTRIE